MFKERFGKKGSEILNEQIIFWVLTGVVLSIFLGYIYLSSNGALVYEKVYAKEIALIIDKSPPGTEVWVDISEGVEIAEKNSISKEIVNLNTEKNMVEVTLIPGKKYSFPYLNDNDVTLELQNNYAYIKIGEKNE